MMPWRVVCAETFRNLRGRISNLSPWAGRGKMVAERVLPGLCRRIVCFLKGCEIHVGRNPDQIHAPALILFPHHPAVLCCGLAGILTLRRKTPPQAAGEGLPILFARAAEKNLPALLLGTISKTAYLGGLPAQEAMEQELFRMKGEEAFGKVFYDTGEIVGLSLLSE
jgi:glucosamine--fructose-6-phosphate aminotransferase (isomerizing)